MSLDEERQSRAIALLDFEEAKQRHAALQNEAVNLAKHYERLATLLKTEKSPAPIDVEALKVDAEKTAKLFVDLRESFNEASRLRAVVTKLGFQPKD